MPRLTRIILEFVQDRLRLARAAPSSDYRDGSIAELEEIEEFIEELIWREGEE